ncbi:MAG: hypothetical protein P4L50_30065 [Anaerolineaceae bacterium]|nr:hypothetical protein [Anaerolineaceae bacterium]
MSNITDWVTLAVSLLSLLISSLISYLVFFNNRQSQRAAIHQEIEHSYDKMMDLRSDHPEIMHLCFKWDEKCFKLLYGGPNLENKQWVLYYTYVELCLGFINSVLYGWDINLLDRQAYENHYKPLVRLLLTEHYQYFSSILDGPYISVYVKKFITEEQNSGWNWVERHKMLAM